MHIRRCSISDLGRRRARTPTSTTQPKSEVDIERQATAHTPHTSLAERFAVCYPFLGLPVRSFIIGPAQHI
eukprot:scaffold54817_cov73-Phaeocystis_antarctica.AAC.7